MMTTWADNKEKENDRFLKRGDDNNGNQRANDNRSKGPREQPDSGRKRRPDDHVAALDRPQHGKKLSTQEQFKKLLLKKCPFHPDSRHSAKECRNLKQAVSNFLPNNNDKKKKDKEEEDKEDTEKDKGYQDANRVVNIIFGGETGFLSKRALKVTLWEILSIELAIPRYLKYSEVEISFSREDQWTSFSDPGKFPLVLDPMVAGVRLTKVLIEGVSGLNVLFASTLHQMGLDINSITPTKPPFYGIVPGNATMPLGTISLPVTFGTRQNYSTEYIKFEVVDFEASYHVILGRPAMARFMAVPHYISSTQDAMTQRHTLPKR